MKKTAFILLVLSLSLWAIEFNWKPLMEPGSGGRLTSLSVSPHDGNRILIGGDMLGVGLSTDRGDSWQTTFGFKSWEIADFTWHPTDPSIVWVGTMSGPYKSVDGGLNWEPKRNGMPSPSGYYTAPIQKVLIDPNDTDILLAVGGSHRRWSSPGSPAWGAIWQSVDAGETWEKITTIGNNSSGKNIVSAALGGNSSEIVYAAVDGEGIFISEDGGGWWENVSDELPHPNVNWVEAHPTNPAIAWVALGNFKFDGDSKYTAGGIFKTEDFGQTWSSLLNGLAQNTSDNTNQTAKYEVVKVSRTNPDVLFTGNTSWNSNYPYISKDGGVSWASTARNVDKCYPAGKSMECAEIDPNDENFILGAGSEFILRTTDGGDSWDDATAYHPDDSKLWRGKGYSGLVCKDFAWDPHDPMHAAFAAMDGGNLWHSRDDLFSWEKAKSPVPNWDGGNTLCFAGEDAMYVGVGQYNFIGIGYTLDGGKSWKMAVGASAGLPNKWENKKATGLYAMPNDETQAWAAVGNKLYYTNNSGSNWSPIFEDANVVKIDGSPQNPLHIFIATNNGVYESFDGQSFDKIGGPSKATNIFADPHDENVCYATSWRENGGLWKYDGSGWSKLHDDHYISAVTIHPENPEIMACVTDDHPYHDECYATGVYVTEDGGETWTQQNEGLPVLRGSCIQFNPHNGNQIVVGTGGRGYFISGGPETKVEGKTEQPMRFELLENYPNPFNPSTTISYEISKTSFVELSVFDLRGRLVQTLINRELPAGDYSVQFSNTELPSGTYFYKLTTRDFSQTRKMLLIR